MIIYSLTTAKSFYLPEAHHYLSFELWVIVSHQGTRILFHLKTRLWQWGTGALGTESQRNNTHLSFPSDFIHTLAPHTNETLFYHVSESTTHTNISLLPRLHHPPLWSRSHPWDREKKIAFNITQSPVDPETMEQCYHRQTDRQRVCVCVQTSFSLSFFSPWCQKMETNIQYNDSQKQIQIQHTT